VVRLRASRPTDAAQALFRTACEEAARLSFAVGVEHLVLACALHGALPVDPDEIRDRIVGDERTALASLGISFDVVRAELGGALDRSDCLPVSPEVKRVLELASRRRRHVTADQLLTTLRTHSATARRLLADLDEPR
jgi:hypothetical protein